MILLDAPALLAWLQGEGGAPRTVRGARVTATDWAEVLDAVRQVGMAPGDAAECLRLAGLHVEAVRGEDALRAAELSVGSLAERINQAVATRLNATRSA